MVLDSFGTPVDIEARQYSPCRGFRTILHAQDVAADALSKSQKKRLKKKATAERKKQEAEENGGEGTEYCVFCGVRPPVSCVHVVPEPHRSTYLELPERIFLCAGALPREGNGHAAAPPTQLQQTNGTAKKGKGR